MSGFNNSSESVVEERKRRQKAQLLRFGISFLDDSLFAIMPDDLILIGAPSGVGKTDLAINIAMANLEDARRIHFFALEAGEFEIERRIKWRMICQQYYSNGIRPRIEYDEWLAGAITLDEAEEWATTFCATALKGLHVFYKSGEDFTANKLIEQVGCISGESDLIIIDHAHYFDWDDDNENRALKGIAKTLRTIALEIRTPIILVAHLRKRSFSSREVAAGLDEFHGSSDLVKIATKVVTVAPGKNDGTGHGKYVTFIRTPKNRNNGSSKVYLARMLYDIQMGSYDENYRLDWASTEDFTELQGYDNPHWMHRTRRRRGGGGDNVPPRTTTDPVGGRQIENYADRVQKNPGN